MDDYINKNKLIEELLNKDFYPAIVKRAIENQPTIEKDVLIIADTIAEIENRLSIHFGTYTSNDTIKISELFSIICKIGEELIENEPKE